MIASNIFDYFATFALTFITIRGESCDRFRGFGNITVDPSNCRMETSWSRNLINRCVNECNKNLKVSSMLKNPSKYTMQGKKV